MKRLQKLGYMAAGMAFTLVIVFSMSTVSATLANSVNVVKQLTAHFTVGGKPISIYVEGEKITPKYSDGRAIEPFVVDGTTYLPVRAVSEALGKTVTWDGTTASVYVGARPGAVQYMTDVTPAYQTSGRNYKEYSAIKSGGSEKFSLSGNTYTNGFTFNHSAWAVYNLNGQYTSFEATFGHVDGSDTGKYRNASIRIYCDGIMRAELEVSDDMYAHPVSLNLTGVNQLKIISANVDGVNDGFFWGEYGFGNPILR